MYYFTGSNDEVDNNYFWYGGHSWRVMEFDLSTNTVLLISQQPLTSLGVSASWSTESSYVSNAANNWLINYFYDSLDSSIQNDIIDNTFNIGLNTDVASITTTQKVGLLDEDQYARAGGTSSYLYIADNFLLGNRNMSSGSTGTTGNGIRPVIKISDVVITGGEGTLTSNYKTSTKATNTSNVQVGEYISVPITGNECGSDKMCTFRVVSKDSDSVKVVLNGVLSSTSIYGVDSTITTDDDIYTALNDFANSISVGYRYTGNKTFYIGNYGSGAHTSVQDETLSANIGLPTIGEMFAGNDIDLSTSSTKRFVNVNTIENPTVSSYYWTMNRNSTTYVRAINSSGNFTNSRVTSSYGVRPVIYLRSGLTFNGGDGTAENPYTVVPEVTLISSLLDSSGLRQSSTDSSVYYFAGGNAEVSNNYLWYGGHHWRIVEFNTSDNTILLISQQPLTSIYAGTSATYLNSWLSDYFYNSLDSRIQDNIVESDFNTGIYPNFGTTSKKVGLLSVSQYNRAGESDSYLNINDYWYTSDLITNSSTIRAVYYDGMLTTAGATSSAYGVRPVIRIKDITISGGDGTLTSNYKSFLSLNTPTTSSVQVGEYIKIPYNGNDGACGSDKMCTFRVVSKDSNSVKVVLNGLAGATYINNDMFAINYDSHIYTYILNDFADNLGMYLYSGSKVFYNGVYDSNACSDLSCATQGSYTPTNPIGIPYAGEMFSGNDIDLSSSSIKTFVDINTIENPVLSGEAPSASTNYWISSYHSSVAYNYINNNGQLSNTYSGTNYGVRPSVYLNSWIIASGDGSAENPYILA